MEWLTGAGSWVLGLIGGLFAGGTFAGIVWVCLKAAFNRALAKANFKAAQKEAARVAAKEAVGEIKKITYTQNIQPLVISEMVKVNERVDARLVKLSEKVIKKLDLIHEENKALARYFDGSLGVTDEAKKGLKVALANYEKEVVPETQEIKVVEVEDEKTQKVENKAKKTENTTIIDEIEDVDVER